MKPMYELSMDRLEGCNLGWRLVAQISDATRKVCAYLDGSGSMAIGFHQTLGPLTFPLSADWAKNFDVRKASFVTKNGLVVEGPAGFIDEYLSLRTWLSDLVTKHKPTALYIAGRSQGGPHALYATCDFLFEPIPITTELFAAPAGISRKTRLQLQAGTNLKWMTQNQLVSIKRTLAYGDPISWVSGGYLRWVNYGNLYRIGNKADAWWPFDANKHTDEFYTQFL